MEEYKRQSEFCVVCGKPLPKFKSKFCCPACRAQFRNASENSPAHGELVKVCIVCGKEFRTYRSRKKTCSCECQKKLRNCTERTDELRAKERERHRKNGGKTGLGWEEYILSLKKKAALKKALDREEKIASMVEKECVICGKHFSDWKNGTVKTCSKECSNELKKLTNRSHDRRVAPDKLIDKDITLRKLFKRDNGICYICGRTCSYDDRDGKRVFGSYPTIEHVVPLALGGEHSWKNVRLACWDCNIKKGVTAFKMPEATPVPNGMVPKAKETLMFSKDGLFIARFKSTVEAGKNTGLRDKGIQKCCRGEQKTYAGYIWKYA